MAPGKVSMARSAGSSPRDSTTVAPVPTPDGGGRRGASTPASASQPRVSRPNASSPVAATSRTERPSLARPCATMAPDPPSTRSAPVSSCSVCPKRGTTSPRSTRSGLASPSTSTSTTGTVCRARAQKSTLAHFICAFLLISGRAAMLHRVTTLCFVGAGSAEFTRQLLRDLLTYDDLGPLTLVMHDIDPGRLRLAEQVAHITVRHHGRDAVVRATADRRAALDGADFVVNTVSIGGHAATLTDFDVPESFGVRQTIADTLGVGGVFRGLRTFGFLEGLASDMEAVCPDAWLLNYTNPMAMNIGYLTATHPALKVLGLCHSVYWTVVDLSALVGVPFDEVSYRSAGVNHQAWVLDWRHDGDDLYPRLDEMIASDPELRRRVRVDMYRRLGYYPTETSEHSSEYVAWYLPHDSEVQRLRIPLRDYVGISAGNVEETRRLMVEAERGDYVEPEEE